MAVVQDIDEDTLGVLCVSFGHHAIKLKRVQKIFTGMLPGLACLSYWEKLGRLGLYFLQHRRMKGDFSKLQ